MLVSRAFQSGSQDPWDLTPGELFCVVGGAVERESASARQAIATAWFGEALSRMDRMPPLEVVTGEVTQEQYDRNALEEQRANYQELTAVLRPPGASGE